MKQEGQACPIRPPAQDGLPHGSQSGRRSRSNNLWRSSPLGSAAWTSCPVLGSWVEWTRDGHIAQAWVGWRAGGAAGGHCSPEGERTGPHVSSGIQALSSEVSRLLLSPPWAWLQSARAATPNGWMVPSSFPEVTEGWDLHRGDMLLRSHDGPDLTQFHLLLVG